MTEHSFQLLACIFYILNLMEAFESTVIRATPKWVKEFHFSYGPFLTTSILQVAKYLGNIAVHGMGNIYREKPTAHSST